MNGKIRRNLTALTMASAMVALAACSPSSSSSSSGSSGDSKNVTLSVWSWRTEDVAAYKAIFAVYEKQHPGTKVDFKAFKNTEYNLILTTGLAEPRVPTSRRCGPTDSYSRPSPPRACCRWTVSLT